MKRAIVALLLCACTSVAQLTAVRAGRLIDPDSGTVLTAQTVLIQGNKIQAKPITAEAATTSIAAKRSKSVHFLLSCFILSDDTSSVSGVAFWN
jgi:predicted house-cleaning NTP pyrophosphatase (Maf/HAM1 superfamily)